MSAQSVPSSICSTPLLKRDLLQSVVLVVKRTALEPEHHPGLCPLLQKPNLLSEVTSMFPADSQLDMLRHVDTNILSTGWR